MPTFTEMLAALAHDGEGYAIDAAEEWAQGRTLFGGMTAALSYAATARAFDTLPPLRSAQLAFVGPAAGRLRFVPALLRRGRSSAVVAVDCLNEEGVAARATLVFGAPRASEVAHDRVPSPAVPAPDACTPLHSTRRELPGFLARYEFRQAAGARLFAGPGAEPAFAVWTRFRDGGGDDPVAALLAAADALPAAAMAVFPRPAALSTMTWQVDVHRLPTRAADWLLVTTGSEAAADGYSLQAMRVFDEGGRPLVSARQLVAIFI